MFRLDNQKTMRVMRYLSRNFLHKISTNVKFKKYKKHQKFQKLKNINNKQPIFY